MTSRSTLEAANKKNANATTVARQKRKAIKTLKKSAANNDTKIRNEKMMGGATGSFLGYAKTAGSPEHVDQKKRSRRRAAKASGDASKQRALAVKLKASNRK